MTARNVQRTWRGGRRRGGAAVFASLILQHDVRRVVEIGVYRGRSLLPLATVLRAVGGGVAMGIDPWAADDAMQYDDHAGGTDAARQWTRDTDWEGIYQSVVDNAQRLGVADIIELVRMPSLAAADLIDPGVADLVHVDGNHDADAVAQDVEKYLPKIRPGGFLALDDASWSSIRPTARMLEDNFERVFELCDNQLHVYDKGGHDFAVYRVSAHDIPARTWVGNTESWSFRAAPRSASRSAGRWAISRRCGLRAPAPSRTGTGRSRTANGARCPRSPSRAGSIA